MKTNSLNRRFLNICIILVLVIFAFGIMATSSYAVSVNPATGKINHEKSLKIRAKANTDKKTKIIAKLKDNTEIIIKKEVFKSKTSTSKSDRWYYIEANGNKGYVQSKFVDGIKYQPVYAWVKEQTNYRSGAGTSMAQKGSFSKDKVVKVYLKATPVKSTKGSSSTWYKVKEGSKYYYCVSTNFRLMPTDNIYQNMTDEEFTKYLKEQGFDSKYRKLLKSLHKIHPNWEFVGQKMPVDWDTAVMAQNSGKISQIQRSGSSKWVVANKKEVSYYLDPRNFITEKYVFMFENLNYNSKYQTQSVVEQILKGTYLETNKFKAEYFVKYGEQYNISPVHMASRARQETGGTNGLAIKGYKYSPDLTSEKKKVYNPFNIGANSSVNGGLKYAYEHGWFTKAKSIKGAAEILADGYINSGQNTLYFEKFNFLNGKASHQYMANIKAPYSESSTTYNSYKEASVINEAYTFVIPIYSGMPESTSL